MIFTILLTLVYGDNKIDASIIYMSWEGNWSISHEKILTENQGSNPKIHINDYWAKVIKNKIGEFTVEIYESPNSTNLVFNNLSVVFKNNNILINDGMASYTYTYCIELLTILSISGKYQHYTFNLAVAAYSRYQLSVFDSENQEWHFFNIIKDMDRHDPTWFEEKFWLYFGYAFLCIFMFILYNFAFNRYTKLADEVQVKREQEKKLPNKEFEDVLTPGYVKKRTPMTYGNTD